MHVQVAADIAARDECREAPGLGGADFVLALANLGRDEGQAQCRVNIFFRLGWTGCAIGSTKSCRGQLPADVDRVCAQGRKMAD